MESREPLYNAGDVLFNYESQTPFIVKEVILDSDGKAYYRDHCWRVYQEEFLSSYVDWLEYNFNQDDIKVTYNTHFPSGYNPVVKNLDREKNQIEFKWSIPLDIFAKQAAHDTETSCVVIEDMRMPNACLNCPMAAYFETDEVICGVTGTVDKNIAVYTRTKMNNCPLRAVHKDTIKYETLSESTS